MSRALFTFACVTSAVAAQSIAKSPVQNESKRRFYENEQQVVPLPGTVTPSTPAEAELLGPRSLVNGVTVRSAAPLESAFRSVRTVAALHNKREDLFPNSIYIIIAGLSGNILARNRNIVSRAVYPVALGVAAFSYFLPQTFRNTRDFVWAAEQRALPEVAKQQVAAFEQANGFVHLVEETAASSQQKVHSGLESLRRSISKITGLNIDEEVLKK
ncbi:hypothetical protein HF325_002403 [Metschnikowia pulcherrima]|uniref:MICOS complex subunit n=1 Tax=Metschnikowia pulcherrima TaxID=27326 RepID=A0A8H7GWS8_9ASCO|nr:hypothetical protein HF325_002403 [Metschnikowia pulcherrima]